MFEKIHVTKLETNKKFIEQNVKKRDGFVYATGERG